MATTATSSTATTTTSSRWIAKPPITPTRLTRPTSSAAPGAAAGGLKALGGALAIDDELGRQAEALAWSTGAVIILGGVQ